MGLSPLSLSVFSELVFFTYWSLKLVNKLKSRVLSQDSYNHILSLQKNLNVVENERTNRKKLSG